MVDLLVQCILKIAKISEERRWSTIVLLYKNKGDIQNCNKYRGIKLLRKFGSGRDEDEKE